ncbi:tryptophan 7-halogenase [Streptomyces sp. Li-HN-5-11]|uniref:NAD(P)/FAD-dependent oxidoreductase n=1 Tax=Streptomyces sp. Li-HN-5-11 TaxID=3075432 RepID=UPI0028B0F596|nr:FAD-dependent monooxygenase [Streptomyces sp. Li-HN-5-11]WNM35015.1 tryptophan 7-halogenase [Streptomyces sp. Li-HN-5-11]
MASSGRDGRTTVYDVGVIGGGFAGPVLASVLARAGVRTLLLEERAQPRFAVGESMVPYASALVRLVARRYDVPELESLATLKAVRRDVSPRCGVLRNMGFVFHRAGLRQHPGEVYQVVNPSVVPDPPHLFRQDVDAHLLGVAQRYGADVRTGSGARVDGVRVDPDSGARLRTRGGAEFSVRYVVDAGGRHAPLARELGLREEPAGLRHHSRCLFTHMTGVTPYDETPAGRASVGASPWHEGTLHHVFDGGWLWVIPFGNQRRGSADAVCSVGLTLDPRRHPVTDRSPQEEFAAVLGLLPDVARQFADARALRPWTATGRLQYSARRIVGDRYCLAAHAAGFVDPLYSRGLAHSLQTVDSLAWRLIAAARDGDWSTERFRPVEDLQRGLLAAHDDLACASFAAFGDWDLFNAVVRVWTLGTVLGALAVENACGAYLRGGPDHALRDDAVLRAPEHGRRPGSPLPDNDHYNSLGPLARTLCAEVTAGTRTPGDAAGRIFAALGAADYVPPALGLADPADRFFHNTPARIVRAARWVRTEAPEDTAALLTGAMRGLLGERLHRPRRPRRPHP